MIGLQLAATQPDATAPAVPLQSGFGLMRIVLVAVMVTAAAWQPGGAKPFGALALGDIAVVLLFVISGYLVIQSHESGLTPGRFLWRRVLRMYPAFALAFVLSLVAAGVSGGDLSTLLGEAGAVQFARLLFLGAPWLDGAYAGLADPRVNPPLWVFGYLFRCGVLVIGLGALGLIAERRALLAVTGILLALSMAMPGIPIEFPRAMAFVTGTLHDNIRCAAYFMVGATYYRYSERLRFLPVRAAVAVALMAPILLSPRYGAQAVAVFGGYALIWFALKVKTGPLGQAVGRGDVAYGMFLYGWPVLSLLEWQIGAQPAWVLAGLTLCLAAGMGGLSWLLLHRTMPGDAAPKAEG